MPVLQFTCPQCGKPIPAFVESAVVGDLSETILIQCIQQQGQGCGRVGVVFVSWGRPLQ
jgi:hypothetical protein